MNKEYLRKNPFEFDCPSCGNPLIKSRSKNSVRCVWCKAIVDYDGNILHPKSLVKSAKSE